VRRLHVIGAVIILLWLAALGWLVWRQRHSETAQPPETAPRAVSMGWHAGCGSRGA
jgi:hypothetical protein